MCSKKYMIRNKQLKIHLKNVPIHIIHIKVCKYITIRICAGSSQGFAGGRRQDKVRGLRRGCLRILLSSSSSSSSSSLPSLSLSINNFSINNFNIKLKEKPWGFHTCALHLFGQVGQSFDGQQKENEGSSSSPDQSTIKQSKPRRQITEHVIIRNIFWYSQKPPNTFPQERVPKFQNIPKSCLNL